MISIGNIGGATPDPFHSSGIRQEAGHKGIGATSPETFSARRHIDNNRNHVNSYRHATVHHGPSADMKSRNSPFSRTNRQAMDVFSRTSGAGGSARTIGAPKPSFKEPTTRRYNPYG